MKNKKSIFLFIIVFLVSCSSNIMQRKDQTEIPTVNLARFSLIFEYTPCGPTPMYSLDTNAKSLIYVPLAKKENYAISFQFTETEIKNLYFVIMSNNFFLYPFDYHAPKEGMQSSFVPFSIYKLSVTNNGITHSVNWKDNILSTPEIHEIEQLRYVMKYIIKTIEQHPEVAQLPKSNAKCL